MMYVYVIGGDVGIANSVSLLEQIREICILQFSFEIESDVTFALLFVSLVNFLGNRITRCTLQRVYFSMRL